MYIDWYHLRRFIDQHKSPWSDIKYYRSKHGFTDTITVCDFALPKRKGVLLHVPGSACAAEDWYVCSQVCNAGWFDSYIPLRDHGHMWDDEASRWIKKPVRGARSLVDMLVGHGSILRMRPVEDFLRTGYMDLA